MNYRAEVRNQSVEGESPDRYFRCDVCVLNEDDEVVRRQVFSWRIGGPPVDQQGVQSYIDRQKERMLSEVNNAEAFDPEAIT